MLLSCPTRAGAFCFTTPHFTRRFIRTNAKNKHLSLPQPSVVKKQEIRERSLSLQTRPFARARTNPTEVGKGKKNQSRPVFAADPSPLQPWPAHTRQPRGAAAPSRSATHRDGRSRGAAAYGTARRGRGLRGRSSRGVSSSRSVPLRPRKGRGSDLAGATGPP